MYEDFRKRMERKGTYMGEIMRRQSDIVVDALWMNSVSTRPVQVKVINQGLPPTYEAPDDFEDVLWAHFEEHNKFNVTKDEQDCYLTFRPGELAQHPEIKPGSYVCVPNVDNEPEWWLIVYIDNDNELRKTQILKCNWVLKWVANGNIYQTLGCQRVANSYNSGLKRLTLNQQNAGTPLEPCQPNYYGDIIMAISNGIGMVKSTRIGQSNAAKLLYENNAQRLSC